MDKAVSILKITLKVILWFVISCVLLLFLIVALIQIPAVQLKIANYVTSSISNKTHTKVELKKINIIFPKSVVIEGLYLEDLQKDTLLYAGRAKVDIVFKDLFNNRIHVNSFILEEAILNINRSEKDSLFNYNFLLTAFRDTTKQKTPSSPLTFSIDNVIIKNVKLHFDDEYAGMNIGANLKQFKIKGALINLKKQLVSVKHIDLTDNNTFTYSITHKPEIKNTFDASHQYYKQVTLKAGNLLYSPDLTEIYIEEFSAVDQRNFSITKFETDFRMDPHSITAKNIKVKTSHSSIEADLMLKYTSLKSLMNSMSFVIVHANIRNMSINNSDILYFRPLLAKQYYFRNDQTITTASVVIDGPINNMTGKKLVIHTGVNTSLKTDFSITGLPDFQTASFNFPNLMISSGRKDIAMFAGTYIPKNVELPENISMQIAFNGAMKSFKMTAGMSSSFGSANLFATIDKKENFISKASFTNFDLGRLLKNKLMYGPATLKAEASGHGMDMKTIQTKIKIEVSHIYLNQYTYHNLKVDGKITSRKFEGKINLNDSNAVFEFDGIVNMNPNQEQYQFRLNLQGINLQKLHFAKDDTRIGLLATANLKGGTVPKINGKADITNIYITHNGKTYKLDSFMINAINGPKKNELTINSALADLKYTGDIFPSDLPARLMLFINHYFSFSSQIPKNRTPKSGHFDIDIQLHNPPILSEVFLPQLKEFDPGIIHGSFDSQNNELKLDATMHKIVYGTTELNNFVLAVNSDVNALNYKISSSSVSNIQINFDNILVEGKLADQRILANVSSIDKAQNKKLLVHSQIVMDKANYKITLDPKKFYLMDSRWDLAADNYIEVGKPGFIIHHFDISKAGSQSQVNISSVHNQFKDDISLVLKNFKIDDVSRIIQKDTNLVKGNVDGNVLLKSINNTYGIIADAQISNLFLREVPIGNLSVKAKNPTVGRFDIDVKLSGADNNLTANGNFVPNGGEHSIHIKTAIQSLSMNTVKAFSFGQIAETSGSLTGDFLIEGSITAPEVTGEIIFNNAFIKPAILNNQFELKHETVQLRKDGIYFNSFTILDSKQHTAKIDGAIQMKTFKDFLFALQVNTQDFLLFNTTAKDNKEYYGKMILDSKIDIQGPMSLPVVNARIKIKKESSFTFAVPEEKLTTDKGEEVVEFEDSLKQNSILYKASKKETQKLALTGVDLSSIIEIDKQATLRLLMDPSSTDSLVVKGDAALSFDIDRSGKMSLTGAYNLVGGSYLVSLESVLKRKFAIESGSTINWNGNPMDAVISINAIYSVSASPIDLIADQMNGLSETDKDAYKQRYPFLVYLKLSGKISRPDINFEIQLAPENKGILGGAVNAKLSLLNEDPSALNKQVFALLVLGRFVQENPLQTETNTVSSTARATVGKLLSAQLNQWSSKLATGADLNFDVQSYDEYQSGQAEGRTQVNIGLKKQLFNDRLNVQVGGVVDVEGQSAKQNSASDITSDVTLEYKITKDGRYRLKGFRHNQYEGAIDGQLVETGAGIQYVRDFNKWKYFFKKPAKKNDTINHK